MVRWNGGARGGPGKGRSKPHPARDNTADFGYAGLGPAALSEPPSSGTTPPVVTVPSRSPANETGVEQTATVQGSTTTTGLKPAYPSSYPEMAQHASYSLELLAHFQCADVVCRGRWSLADPQGRLLKEGATLHSKAWYCPWCGLAQSATQGVA
jgi:hypothetical protein